MRIRRHRWLITTLAVGGLALAGAVSLAMRVPITANALRSRVIAELSDRLDAEVELEHLSVRILPRPRASGTGLTVRFQRRHDVPPLISIREFTIEADLIGLWHHRVARVGLTGLDIQIPPRVRDEGPGLPTEQGRKPRSGRRSGSDFVITRLEAPDAQLTILRRDAAKPPRVWYMHRLDLRDVGMGAPMPFETFLTNAVPPGQIAASGTFGPWQRESPGATPLEGRFTFDNANLGVFKGISGTLSSRGAFNGALNKIEVSGQTSTPDFMVNLSGHQVPLETTYHAVVDGTNGNTTLDPVEARVLDTTIRAAGGVYEVEGVKGRVVQLDVSIEDGRIEDVLRMAVPTPNPVMTGGLRLTARMTIPPGPVDVVDKLELDGRFAVERGRFTDPGVQQKINDLSRRARGLRAISARESDRARSNFSGRFTLNDARLALPSLSFDVPGAVVSLGGAYALRQQTLNFSGRLYMDAKLSQTTTGWKSWLLKAADPVFRKNGKTVVPLKISGTRNDPKFGLDVKRVFRH